MRIGKGLKQEMDLIDYKLSTDLSNIITFSVWNLVSDVVKNPVLNIVRNSINHEVRFSVWNSILIYYKY